MKHKLEIDSVMLSFGTRRILNDVYLSCETGKVTGLLGRNGTGKSSLFKILFGMLRADHQSIRFNGQAILGRHRPPRLLRYLPQQHFIPDYLTVKRALHDFDLNYNELCTYFPKFENHEGTKLVNLSSGLRRIVELFAIIKSTTHFCILDEPFSQIMPLHVETISTIIEQEKRSKGFLISDHMYRHILDLSDDLYLIRDGKTYAAKDLNDLERLGYVNPGSTHANKDGWNTPA